MKILPVFVACLLFVGCGKENHNHVKDYVLSIQTEDPELREGVTDLIARYNGEVGFDALKIAEAGEASNSQLTFSKGLEQREGKLGYGQWHTKTETQGGFGLNGDKEKTTTYGMTLEFDLDYLKQRLTSDRNSERGKELYLLFCHEIGHGLKMGHFQEPKQVMYPYIDGLREIDYSAYFLQVQTFFR